MTRCPLHGSTRGRRRARGFTLIEMVVTIAIIAVTMAIAAPSFMSFQRNSELTSTANAFVGALAAARSEALKRQLNAFVIPTDNSNWANGWTVFVDSNRSNTITYTSNADLLIAKSNPVPTTVTTSNGFAYAGGLYVEFNGAGFMTTTAGGIATSGSLDFTSVSGEVRRVIANPAGRMRVCKPTAAGCNANDL